MDEKPSGDAEKGALTGEDKPENAENARLFFIKTSHMAGLRAMAEFVIIMGYIYVCDRTTLIAKGKKQLTPTGFWITNGLILLAGIATLRHNHGMSGTVAEAKPLQRDQTEEWKGSMQIMCAPPPP